MKKILKAFPFKAVIVLAILYILIMVGISIVNVVNKSFNNVGSSFASGKVLNEFKTYVTELKGSNKLKVASIKSVDKFSKKDSQSILWELISLPDVIIEIQTPVEYNYYVDLKGKWQFRWNENDSSISVIAPSIECGTPAVDISNLEIIEKKSSILRDNEKVKDDLKKELSSKLSYVAEKKIKLVREIAREEIKTFLRTWLFNSFAKDDNVQINKIDLKFEDEIHLKLTTDENN